MALQRSTSSKRCSLSLTSTAYEDGRFAPPFATDFRLSASRSLHFDLHAQFHHALRRKAEERCRTHGIARHQDEQMLAPDRHATSARDDDRLATEKVSQV